VRYNVRLILRDKAGRTYRESKKLRDRQQAAGHSIRLGQKRYRRARVWM